MISMFGGSDMSTFIKLCLENVFTNNLAILISITGKINKYFGTTPKLSLKTLELFNLICGE